MAAFRATVVSQPSRLKRTSTIALPTNRTYKHTNTQNTHTRAHTRTRARAHAHTRTRTHAHLVCYARMRPRQFNSVRFRLLVGDQVAIVQRFNRNEAYLHFWRRFFVPDAAVGWCEMRTRRSCGVSAIVKWDSREAFVHWEQRGGVWGDERTTATAKDKRLQGRPASA
jgi:hypothetical protein